MQNKINLGNDNILALLFRISTPAIISMVVAALYNFVDRVVVGRVNPVGLSAIGITMPFQVVQMGFVLLIGVGAATIISIKYGKGEIKEASDVLFTAFISIVVSQVFLSILCMMFINQIFSLLRVSNALHGLAFDYISIIVIGAAVALTGYCLNNCVRSLGHAKESMFYVTVSSILNIVLDVIFVFVFKWGVQGAAIATIISECLVSFFVIRFFLSEKAIVRLNFSREYISNFFKEKRYLNSIKEIISAGTPSFFMQVFGLIVNILLNNSIMKYGGDYHMAAVTIVNSISMMFTMVIYGVSQGMQPIVGFNFGKGDFLRVKKTFIFSLIIVFFVTGIGLAIIQFFPKFLASIFVDDDELSTMTAKILRICLLGLPMIGAHSIASTFMQSIKKSLISTILYILRFGGILIPLLYIFPSQYGINGVYISNAISDISAGAVALIISFVVIKGGNLKTIAKAE